MVCLRLCRFIGLFMNGSGNVLIQLVYADSHCAGYQIEGVGTGESFVVLDFADHGFAQTCFFLKFILSQVELYPLIPKVNT